MPHETVTELSQLIDRVKSYNVEADLDLVRRAYAFSAKAHEGQMRRSGEPYFRHPLAVAGLLTHLKTDVTAIVAGLLHDTLEDTLATPLELEQRFGKDVVHLVDGGTKNGKITFRKDKEKQAAKVESAMQPKILDTSVIIDGRIADICKTGFIEGPLIIPAFVLEELRHIADSSDALKRNRGRRGLDILNRIQKELDINVEIVEKDFEELTEVDTKLLKLAQYMNGKVITNDYNLNKVAEFQRVPVLNINELANAVKPVVLPGEEMIVQVIKDGKEFGQGVAYLDDGTMIVVDGGKRYIGDTIEVVVTSVLQTAAGRMIFVKPKSAADKVS